MTEDIEFKLTKEEVYSALWAKIKEHLEERLARHRLKNDGDLSPEATAKTRGRIKEIVSILGIGQPDLPEKTADNGE